MKRFFSRLVDSQKPVAPRRASLRPVVEALERRDLMAASIGMVGSQLRVHGTDHDDVIRIDQVRVGKALKLEASVLDRLTGASITRRVDAVGVKSIRVEGRDGSDVVRNNLTRGATLVGGDGHDLLVGGAGLDVIYGGAGVDSIYGREGNDLLYGEGDDDLIFGGLGRDTIRGGDGHDLLAGESGNDAMYGQAGHDEMMGDHAVYAIAAEIVSDRPEMQLVLDLMQDPVNVQWGNDVMEGGDGDDRLWGHDGADTLLGGAGEDVLGGENGNDHIDGGADDDILIGGDGDDVMRGRAGDDNLAGDEGDDEIWGDSGADFIGGYAGDDVLVGGEGFDHFDYYDFQRDGTDTFYIESLDLLEGLLGHWLLPFSSYQFDGTYAGWWRFRN